MFSPLSSGVVTLFFCFRLSASIHGLTLLHGGSPAFRFCLEMGALLLLWVRMDDFFVRLDWNLPQKNFNLFKCSLPRPLSAAMKLSISGQLNVAALRCFNISYLEAHYKCPSNQLFRRHIDTNTVGYFSSHDYGDDFEEIHGTHYTTHSYVSFSKW